jgi:hypothetical protein
MRAARRATRSVWFIAHGPAASFAVRGSLAGVAATSASNAWAVGCANCFTSTSKTLIVRWNGKVWRRVPSPSPGAGAGLSAVAAVRSATW